ncbi:MAG TPA: T9SS type A sorting domain-containing protein, partial [Bacteroidetes bacterium]|nr:T9SS type A sorting domain-containing protein [Bacteroidota bacterium]
WTKINNQNIAFFQAWYAHDIAINPANSSEMMYVGVDAWKSTDTGNSFAKRSDWQRWVFGEIPEGQPGGTDSAFVHGDIHAVYYHPLNNKVYLATDGGVFSSDNGEPPYAELNGGLKTLQLYADMASSASDPELFTGGAQDNSTYIHKENERWFRVIGGDGMSTAINAENDSIIYGSFQGLNVAISTDRGGNYNFAKPTLRPGDSPAFLGPYELAPTDQDIIYGGAGYLYKSIDGGTNWDATANVPVDTPNWIVKIAISPENPDLLYIGTSPHPFLGTSTVKIMKSIDGGQNFTTMSGLPNRVVKDIEFDPTNENTVYITFSGFGTNHVYRTTNGGNNWTAIDNGLPDLPVNTILIDPLNPGNLYVGNDLTVYYSENSGASWEVFDEALPEAVMVYDLNDSPSNRKIRIATHGHGFFQRDYVNLTTSVETLEANFSEFKIYPNPAADQAMIEINAEQNIENIRVELNNVLGQNIATVFNGNIFAGQNKIELNNLNKYPAGNYFIKINSPRGNVSKQFIIK